MSGAVNKMHKSCMLSQIQDIINVMTAQATIQNSCNYVASNLAYATI